jgi:hypothetical protein
MSVAAALYLVLFFPDALAFEIPVGGHLRDEPERSQGLRLVCICMYSGSPLRIDAKEIQQDKGQGPGMSGPEMRPSLKIPTKNMGILWDKHEIFSILK